MAKEESSTLRHSNIRRRITQETHSGRIDGHTINRIRRGRETSKSVLHRIIAIATAIATVTTVASSRIRVVLLAGTRAEDAAYDGTNDYKDGDGDTNLEPGLLLRFGGAGGDVTGRFVVIRVSGTVWSGMLCTVVVVIRGVVDHFSGKSFRVFAWKETGTASKSQRVD